MDAVRLNTLSLDVIQGKKGALRRYLEILQRSFKIQGDTGVIKPHSDQMGFVLARTGTFLQKPGSKILIPSGIKLQESGLVLCSSHLENIPPVYLTLLDKTLNYGCTNETSIRDSLTGLLNRRGFSLKMRQLIEEAKARHLSVCVLFIDGDGLKFINDHFGHSTGDNTIAKMGHMIGKIIRNNDLAARQSGDEFCIGLLDASPEKGARVGERILRRFALVKIGKKPLTASIGVSGEGYDLERLLEEADQAMYMAKEGGRARVCLYHA